MLNRSLLIVTAKQPFLDWLNALPDEESGPLTLDKVNEDRQVYLLPDIEMVDDTQSLIREYSELIFECELEGWWTDEADWPQDRSFKVFRQWFDCSLYGLIQDLVDEPLLDDADEPLSGLR